ncbi:cysteine-rich KTR domain-containing protein [Ruminococcaceae bacterium OttesenSCG-928-A16]|nr:cysteine-rich KTR domain-containing protein [Eubacteriales bacterium OttesenSCG-928-N13]MDL2252750.1 cysteine-rich KTR domain-containing protein [Ruminococcaceae bacterium OttesenSCG-928-I18]MDL2325077.1 cysteine-rich KTR domain-containing protein [Ruminococcaceae bacterium OttesenSCG-928-A16]MDL2327804.1 cysteine-rich KTR domain-containing protein [Ruminococcaceae bacterium OttesenSCG-928-A11]
MQTTKWIHCPTCGNKTRARVREDTKLENFPLFCPKCKQETLINVSKLNITLIAEPDAKTQEE